MSENNTNPFTRWRYDPKNRHLSEEAEIGMSRVIEVSHVLGRAIRQYEDEIEPWLQDASRPEPDLVANVAAYGYSRFLTGDWKSIPLAIPAGELQDWQENSGLLVTVEEIRDWEAMVAGGVAEMLAIDRNRIVALLQKQVHAMLDQLAQFERAPLESFAPTQWSLEEFGDQEAGYEMLRLDTVFDLVEKLMCFQHGLEMIRMVMISDTNSDFGLPSVEFYEALLQIESLPLSRALLDIEPRLKEILKLWGSTTMEATGKPYHRPYDDRAPEQFWWRHPHLAKSNKR